MNITEPLFDDDEIVALKKCLDSKWVTQGPFAAEFEKLFAQRHQVTSALTTTSCTAALHLATLALGLKAGDEVIVPAFTWVTSANCAEYVGAKAVFADVEIDSYNLDPDAMEAAITPRTRAVVAVHLFGMPARMNEIMAIASRHGLSVIEDAACAVGTTYRGTPVGGLGRFGCFSFHPRKVISTGEGGMITTNDSALSALVASLRNHGATGPAIGDDPSKPYTMSTFRNLGFNLRMSDIQAAIGVAQMAKLDRLLVERRRLATHYHELLSEVPDIAPPIPDDGFGHSYQSYVIRLLMGGLTKRNEIMDELAKLNIQTRPGTHSPYRLGYYTNKYGLHPYQFPIARTCEETTITLPIFPGMTEEQQKFVVNGIKRAILA